MEAIFRLRPVSEIQQLFDVTMETEDFDDEESESGDEKHVEMLLNDETVEYVESDEEKMDETSLESTSQSLMTNEQNAEPPMKKHREQQFYLWGENGYKWSRNAPERLAERKYPNYTGTPKASALDVKTPLEAWSLFIDDEILNIILIRTNEEIDRELARMSSTRVTRGSHHKHMEISELRATIGLLYFAGLSKVNNTEIRELWSSYFSWPIFRMTMSEHRFKFLMLCMRFDDKSTRNERKSIDRLAQIREIWEKFNGNCTANYEPHLNCTINEHLLPFRGECSFRISLPKRSYRYGLKIVTLNDATTHYTFNAIPYCGFINDKDETEPVPSYYIRRLSEPIYGTGRNITCDSRFTSVAICQKMLEDYNITMVGELYRNHGEIPAEFKRKSKDGGKARFAYDDDKVLLSFNPKTNKILLILSSRHEDRKIDEATGKPELVFFYHQTKSRTESFEKKFQDFTTARRTRRWSMRYFYGMLDQANVNSFIIYTLLKDNVKKNRRDYIRDLSIDLIKPFLTQRLTCHTLQTVLRTQIESFLNNKDTSEDQVPRDLIGNNKMPKAKRCGLCPSANDRKTLHKCLRCDSPMCRDHTAKICCECCIHLSG